MIIITLPLLVAIAAFPSATGAQVSSALRVNYLISLSNLTQSLGGTHIILSFLEPSKPSIPAAGDDAWIQYAVAEWRALPAANRSATLLRLHDGGSRLMASLGGAAASHAVYSQLDPALVGRRAANYVLELGLDGLDIDLEGWGNDPAGAAYLRAVTLAARATFPSDEFVLSHAPEMPDFWHSTLYTSFLAERAAFDAVSFVNVQMYNQVPFPDSDSVFTRDIYDPEVDAPTSLRTIAEAVARNSNETITSGEVQNKLLLGFPFRDGSFPVGGANLNCVSDSCASQYALVAYGVGELGFDLRGVFEWTADYVTLEEVAAWNLGMERAMVPDNATSLPHP